MDAVCGSEYLCDYDQRHTSVQPGEIASVAGSAVSASGLRSVFVTRRTPAEPATKVHLLTGSKHTLSVVADHEMPIVKIGDCCMAADLAICPTTLVRRCMAGLSIDAYAVHRMLEHRESYWQAAMHAYNTLDHKELSSYLSVMCGKPGTSVFVPATRARLCRFRRAYGGLIGTLRL